MDEKTFIELEKSAESGSVNDMYKVALRYEEAGDHFKAKIWYKRAANKGHVWSMRRLGYYYKYDKCIDSAKYWFTRAANNGDDEAALEMGYYWASFGGNAFWKMAVKYFILAEKNWDEINHPFQLTAADRCSMVADIYFSGGTLFNKKIFENPFNAAMWYEIAAKMGAVYNNYELGNCYFHGNGVNRDYFKAMKYYFTFLEAYKAEHKNYHSAKKNYNEILSVLSSSENVNTLYDLANCYFWGHGVKQNVETAMKWYIKAAENGKIDAVTKVCDYYYYTKKDSKAALRWAEQLGKTGDTDGLYINGLCLIDENKAAEGAEKLRLAADKGHRPAMFALGEYYRKNENHTAAFYWYKRSVEVKKSWMKKSEAYYQLGRCYHYGLGTKKNYQEAYTYYKASKTYSSDFTNLLYDMAMECYRANSTPPDYKRAVKYFTEAQSFSSLSKAKRKKAEYIIGFCYYHGGYGVQRNYKKAVLWLERAYNNGMKKAAIDIANCYFYGKYCLEKDYKAVVRWLKPCAEKSKYAQFLLGECYSKGGYGIKANPKTAFFYYNLSAEGGNTNAIYTLAQYYLKGIGVKSNTQKGAEWLKKAADNGHTAAVEEYRKYKPAPAPRSTERKPETTANSSKRNNYPPRKTADISQRKAPVSCENTKSLYELNADSLDGLFKTDAINVLTCYLREIICCTHNNFSDWFNKRVIEQDRLFRQDRHYRKMVINRRIFEEVSKKSPDSIIEILDISALSKILNYRMEDKYFLEKNNLSKIHFEITEFRDSLFHSGKQEPDEEDLAHLKLVIGAMRLSKTQDLHIKEITENYLMPLENIHKLCALIIGRDIRLENKRKNSNI